jgi:tetratricopeptide (TPR) repeat protein
LRIVFRITTFAGMTTIELDEVIGAARELAKAGRWNRAARLLDASAPDNDKDRARISLAAVEVALESDWFGGTSQARERLKAAQGWDDDPQSGWDLAFLGLRIDYRDTIIHDGEFQPGPEGTDPEVMADLRRRAQELGEQAPDGVRAGWASMYLGLIADNVYGERDAAPAHYEVALQKGEEGDDLLAREALRHLGDHDHENGDYELALERWGRATELGAGAGAVCGTLSQQIVLAMLARDTGDEAGAALLAREIARWAGAIGAESLATQAKGLITG